MNILLIGMNFYNYEVMIKEELEEQGHNVDLMNDVPDNFTTVRRMCSQKFVNRYVQKFQEKELKKREKENYDLVLVIVGRFLTEEFFQTLKSRNKDTRFILYLWDDVARVENFEMVKAYYDAVFSFDPIDCKNEGFKFLPLFYTKEFVPDDRTKKYDIYSAVSEHSDRIHIIKQIIAQNKDKKLLFFINMGRYGYMRWKINKTLKKQSDIPEMKYVPSPIDKKDNIEYMKDSVAILDIQFSTQKGLTIRTLESLACKTKLITTNPTIKLYDFYHPNNIYVLDRENPKMDWGFLSLPYCDNSQEVYEKYSLKEWAKTIIAERENKFLKDGKSVADF